MPGASAESDVRLERLERTIAAYGPTLTAFSGGVDSTLVAVVSARVHGDRALAVTGISASLSADERERAAELAAQVGLRHVCIETHELARPGYRANQGDRCYHCKTELFERLVVEAKERGLDAVACGDNLDDMGGHRPGLVAAGELDVRKPLVEAGLAKQDVRALARILCLPNHKKPASPCLASRVPHGIEVDAQVLARIEAAEAAVRELGFSIFRVRHHGDLARVEMPSAQMPRALELRTRLTQGIKRAGYHFVALDLSGFRSGSLNIVLEEGEQRNGAQSNGPRRGGGENE